MTKLLRWWFVMATVAIPLLLAGPATAQDVFEVWNGGEGLWTNDDNWTLNGEPGGAPSLDIEEGAQINGGTVIIDADVDTGGLLLNGGTIDIRSGSLTSDATDFQSGITNLNGTVRVAAGAKFTGPDVTVQGGGRIELLAPTSGFEAKGDLTLGGSLLVSATAEGTSNIKVGGAASVGGVVSLAFDGVTPAFGDSYPFISGASSITNGGVRFELPETVTLGRGLRPVLSINNGTASAAISSIPVLSLNRATGAVSIENVEGDAVTITGYSIGSSGGLLNPQGWNSLTDQSVADWVEANPREQGLAELNVQSDFTLEVGSPLALGNAYNAARGVPPSAEDVTFRFSTTDDQVLDGFVEFTGPANDLVLKVDPDTGEAAIQNLSQFTDPFDITVYSVFSESGALSVDGWNSLADAGTAGWTEANPRADAVAELNLTNSQLFGNGQSISLGNLFTPGGTKDLLFEFGTTDNQLRFGTVEYGKLDVVSLPGDCNNDGVVNAQDLACVATIGDRDIVLAALNTLPGDLDGNGDVAFPDFLVLSTNFNQDLPRYTDGNINLEGNIGFPDFLILSTNFNKTPPAAAAVPEPSSLLLASLVPFCLLGRRRRRNRSHDVASKFICSKGDVMSFKKQWALPASVGRPRIQQTFGAWVVTLTMMLASNAALAQQTIFDFDTTGPTSTEELGNFMTFFGHDPDSWNVDPNPLLPANLNALHPRSNGTNVESFFTTVGIFNGLVGEDVVYSADISSPDNDIMGMYVRFTGSSNEPLGNTYYYAGLTTNGSTDSYRLHKVKDGVEETLASGVGPAFAAGSETAGETHKLQIAAKTVGNTVELTVSLDDQPITNMDPFVDATNPILGAGQVGVGQSTQPAYFDNISFLNTGGNFVLGDFNGDLLVDTNDFGILAANFNAPGGLAEGDLDFNGQVNAADFLVFREIFNSQLPAGAAAVPEPGSALLVLVGLVTIFMNQRRKSSRD